MAKSTATSARTTKHPTQPERPSRRRAGVEEERQSLMDQARELIERAAEKSPRLVVTEEKMKIANMVAQRLHITSEEQMKDFCDKFWKMFEHVASLGQMASVQPKRTPDGKRIRLSPARMVRRVSETAAK